MCSTRKVFLLVGLLLLIVGSIQAETLYVTDRILLGVHSEPNEESPLLDSVTSGSAVEVLESGDAFKRVRLQNGKEGWVSSGYLVAEQPATAQLDRLKARQKKLEQLLKTTKEKLSKKDRELQIRLDELSNARTTIRELKKKKKSVATPQVDTKMAEELAAANQEIENLKQQLAEQQKNEPVVIPADEQDLGQKYKQLEEETALLRGRIEIAMANLSGKLPPAEDELERLHPRIPAWYWALIVMILIVGIIAGILWMDYRYRQRHGGFRV